MKNLSPNESQYLPEYKPARRLFKGIKFAVCLSIILLLVSSPIALRPKSGMLNVYNWSNYIPSTVLFKFEKETGILVNYSEYDSNEILYAKLKTNPKSGYDVIVPSSYFVQRMAKQDMLQPLDLKKLPNVKYLNPLLMHQSFDPKNQYSLPFTWGTTGIMVNDRYYDPKTIKDWKNFWDPQFVNQLLLLNDARGVFSIALKALGYSINETHPKRIHEAYLKLRKLLPNVKLFNTNATISIYTDEDARIGMVWSGDAYSAVRENPHLHYILPKSGTDVWIDCFAIPKDAPHLDSAYQFINFLMRPEIAAEIVRAQGYSSSNRAGMQLLPPEIRNNPIINPKPSDIRGRESLNDVGPAKALYEHYWQLLKISS